jgi:catechol 2,3-dioxygenase-like lactoylglutathione lyase family enzyme
MKYICPLITVSDIKKSREFYEKILNQRVKYDHGENLHFHGDFSLHLRSHFKGLINNREIQPGVNHFELYFENDDLERIELKLKENGVRIIHETREQPWRQKVLRFYDPDDIIIEVGESPEILSVRLFREGMAPEKICEILNLPLEFVTKSINKYKDQRT